MADGDHHARPAPEPIPAAVPSAPVVDFSSAATVTLEHLHRRVGLDSWAVARRDGEDYVVLAALDGSGTGPHTGDVMAWCDTFCAAVLAGDAPRFSTHVQDVPAWDHARAATGFPWRSYLSVPLTGPDGTVLGSLCAGAHEAVAPVLEECMADVELAAGLLGTLLAYEVRLQHEARRAERAEAASERDALTGVGNRRAWDAALAAEEARARRLGSTASVLVLDLDALKQTNDTHGHDAGDALLVRTAQVLREELRAVDLVVRLGGDEFAVLLPDLDHTAVLDLVARLQTALRHARVRASLGAATRRAATGLEAAWHRADAEMYATKAARAGQAELIAAAHATAPGADGAPVPARDAGGDRADTLAAGVARTVQGLASIDESVLAERIEHLLEAARRQLGMDAAVLAHFDGRTWRLRHTATAVGVPDPVGFACDLSATYCHRLLAGHLRAVIADTRADPVTAELAVTGVLDIGAYVAAPVHLVDGTLYGTVCLLSRSAQPDLRARDAGVLELLAEALSAPLSAQAQQSGRRRDALARLEHLTATGGPDPVYQPVVDLGTLLAIGHEALSRFPAGAPGTRRGDEPGDGPEAWFAHAAEAGLGVRFELTALRKALQQRPRTPGALFLNVSPALAASPALARALRGERLDEIVVEITEHEQVQDYPTLVRHLAPLRGEGLRVAVDDAGAGFASMRHVLALHPDFIKLDTSLIRGIHTDGTRQALIASLVTFAGRTGAHLIAEGIETAAELRCLRTLDVPHGQGFHLGRPTGTQPG